MPPGITPPLIMRYSASTVPILQLSLGSNTLPEQAALRHHQPTSCAAIWPRSRGRMLPWPYGGKQRQVMVDLDPDKLYGYGLSAADVSQRHQQSEPDPSRRHREDRHAGIPGSSSTPAPTLVDGINDLPIKSVNGSSTVYIKDVAHVSDKYLAADQHRARRRQEGRARADLQTRRRLDAGHRQAA